VDVHLYEPFLSKADFKKCRLSRQFVAQPRHNVTLKALVLA